MKKTLRQNPDIFLFWIMTASLIVWGVFGLLHGNDRLLTGLLFGIGFGLIPFDILIYFDQQTKVAQKALDMSTERLNDLGIHTFRGYVYQLHPTDIKIEDVCNIKTKATLKTTITCATPEPESEWPDDIGESEI